MKKKYKFIMVLIFLCTNLAIFAFDDGFIFGLKSRFSGSHTVPQINDVDRKAIHADSLQGLTGFIMDGEFEFGYIFDSPKYFKMKDNHIFGGLELDGFIGLGQGFTGQKTTAVGIDTFLNVFFTPTVRFGTKLKIHLLHNRLGVIFGLGGRMIADPNPEYMGYSSNPKAPFPNGMEVGTIIVRAEDRKRMNPFGAVFEIGLEYTQPIISTTELIIGGYMSYIIYKPGGLTMPTSLKNGFESNYGSLPKTLKSYYLNSLDFGLTLGIRFKA